MNRSTIFQFLREDTELEHLTTKIGKSLVPTMRVPFKWETPFLIINSWRITDFQAIMLFAKELVVRFGVYDDSQINIPYTDIEYIEVHEELDVKYLSLHNSNKVQR